MEQNITPAKVFEKFVFRVLSIYILFYVLFLSDYSHVLHLHFISVELIDWLNNLFIHKQFFRYIPSADSYWAYLSSLVFFILALVISFVWILFKGKSYSVFDNFVFIIARYFVAFTLLYYGIEKIDGIQFTIMPSRMIHSVGSLDSFNLYWMSMGASKSYAFFGGLLEVIAAILLLFRKTSTIGCLVAIPVLANVLMLNIGFDIPIKLKTFHLLFFCIFILAPDIGRLYKFFILKKPSALRPTSSLLITNRKFYLAQYLIKTILIGYVLFTIIKDEIRIHKELNHSPHQNLIGIFNVKEPFSFMQSKQVYKNDSLHWKKFSFNQFNGVQIQLLNDSIIEFLYKPDLVAKTIELNSWIDTSSKMKLKYAENSSGDWLFQSVYKTDSLSFIATKVGLSSLPLLKDRGKVKWKYD